MAEVDLSRLSTSDLEALRAGDLSKVSTAGLMHLKRGSMPKMEEPAFEKEAREIISTTPAELIAANPMARVLVGAAKPFIGAADLVERTWGGSSNRDRLRQLEEMQRRGNRALGFGLAGPVADVSGAVISPLTVAAATKTPQVAGQLARAVQAGEIGALAGLTSGGERPLQDAAIGAAVSAPMPGLMDLAGKAGRGIYHAAIEPWARPAALRGRAYLEAAGDKADEIMRLLRENRQIVPGSAPTAGEAAVPAASAEFAALQDAASKIRPSEYVARTDAQNAARLAALRTVGQDKAALAAAQGQREAAAGPLYQAARTGTAPVDTSAVRGRIDQMIRDNPGNKELVTELSGLKRGLMSGKGKNAIPRERAQEIASALDGLKAAIAKEDNKFITGQLTAIKEMLSDTIPGYRQAQQVFAERSAPINQMQVGQYLESRLRPALDDMGRQRPEAFAQAVQDVPGTLMKRSGVPLSKPLQDVLTPEQMQVIQGVQADLARMQRMGTLAQRGREAAPDVSAATKARLPNMLERATMVMNAIVTRLEGRINKKIAADIAAEMLNPPAVAETMAAAAKRRAQNEALARTLDKLRVGATVGGIQAAEQ